MPGDLLPRPRVLTEQIVVALTQLRAARDAGEMDREWFWSGRLDHLLDIYTAAT